jgi:hypothetical protein
MSKVSSARHITTVHYIIAPSIIPYSFLLKVTLCPGTKDICGSLGLYANAG